MNGLLLIFYTVSISVSCLTLGLAVTNAVFHKAHWCRWYVVFQACLLFTIALGFLDSVSVFFFSPKLSTVFNYIFRIMEHATMAFVTVLLPYFLRWLLGTKWGNSHRAVFYTAGSCYFAAGLVSVLIRNNFYAQIIQTPIFILDCVYCVLVMRKNLSIIEDKPSRDTCMAISIVTLCLIPLGIVSLLIVYVDAFSYPTYVLAMSIIMLSYFFNRFHIDASRLHKKNSLDEKTLEHFKITDREMSVIKLVCTGLTNKEIAGKLNISVNTVNNHVANIFEKTGARSRVDLMRMLKIDLWN